MIKDLKVVSLHIAEQVASVKHRYNAWVSIVDPDDYEAVQMIKEVNKRNNSQDICHFATYFYDVEGEATHLLGPDEDSVSILVNFLQGLVTSTREYNVLIHCFAGACRSTAAAFILLRLSGMDNGEAMQRLLEITPFAWPNTMVLHYADQKLCYTGNDNMEEFVKNWKKSMNGVLFTGPEEKEKEDAH